MDVTAVRGKEVYLPDGRRLGRVHDAVIDLEGMALSLIHI